MNTLSLNRNLDMDEMILLMQRESSEGDQEIIRSSTNSIRNHSQNIQEKRKEQLENIKEQLQGPGAANGCVSILKSIFKVFDLLLKPISMVTGGQLKMELGKALERLQKAQAMGKLTHLQINQKEMGHAISSIKKLLQEDMSQIKEYQEKEQQQSLKIMEILDSLQQSFESSARQ